MCGRQLHTGLPALSSMAHSTLSSVLLFSGIRLVTSCWDLVQESSFPRWATSLPLLALALGVLVFLPPGFSIANSNRVPQKSKVLQTKTPSILSGYLTPWGKSRLTRVAQSLWVFRWHLHLIKSKIVLSTVSKQ